jgi:hypothetical protein|tara:strand:+ start:374 stop:1063 length:690 start_codon:yes stop_codon:yes gene_type:complete
MKPFSGRFFQDGLFRLIPLLAIMAEMGCATDAMSAGVIRFDDAPSGKAPPGWQVTLTGRGNPHWTVVRDVGAPSGSQVLKQSGTASFPLCLKQDTALKDGSVEVKFKPLSGRKDQAAGLVWRCTDAHNYYVVRANALEDNVVMYKMHKGKRSSLDIVGRKGGYGVKVKVPRGKWGSLKVTFAGSWCAVFLNGKKLFEVEDKTFGGAGQVGLWTKADSVTLFDDFTFGGK